MQKRTLSNPLLIKEVGGWQKPLLREYQQGYELHFKEEQCGLWSAHSQVPRHEFYQGLAFRRSEFRILPRVKAVIVGLDIREYSKRPPEVQLFLTLNLHSSIRLTRQELQRSGLISPDEPRIVVQTGDGAYVVFTFLDACDPFELNEKWKGAEDERAKERLARNKRANEAAHISTAASDAMSFVFALNAILAVDAEQRRFELDLDSRRLGGDQAPAFPIECRYALSYDDVLLLVDINGSLNCVGSGMVTCSRILASDKGAHLLVDEKLLRDLEPSGGLMGLGGGLWGQELHTALMDETQVKKTSLRYADVFGFYHDAPLLEAFGRSPDQRRAYHIGSHNVGSLTHGQ